MQNVLARSRPRRQVVKFEGIYTNFSANQQMRKTWDNRLLNMRFKCDIIFSTNELMCKICTAGNKEKTRKNARKFNFKLQGLNLGNIRFCPLAKRANLTSLVRSTNFTATQLHFRVSENFTYYHRMKQTHQYPNSFSIVLSMQSFLS